MPTEHDGARPASCFRSPVTNPQIPVARSLGLPYHPRSADAVAARFSSGCPEAQRRTCGHCVGDAPSSPAVGDSVARTVRSRWRGTLAYVGGEHLKPSAVGTASPAATSRPTGGAAAARRDREVRWYYSAEVAAGLARAGIRDLASALLVGEPLTGRDVARSTRHGHKGVAVVALPDGDRGERVFIKRQWRHASWLPRWSEWRRGIAYLSAPRQEWSGLMLLRAAGFDAAEPLALFHRGARRAQSAIVTRGVPGKKCLGDTIADGEVAALDAESRQALAEAVAGTMARLHALHLSWRSMESKHLFPVRTPDGAWKIWLIDCEAVERGASRRQRSRDLAKLLKTLRFAGADAGFLDAIARSVPLAPNRSGCASARARRALGT